MAARTYEDGAAEGAREARPLAGGRAEPLSFIVAALLGAADMLRDEILDIDEGREVRCDGRQLHGAERRAYRAALVAELYGRAGLCSSCRGSP